MPLDTRRDRFCANGLQAEPRAARTTSDSCSPGAAIAIGGGTPQTGCAQAERKKRAPEPGATLSDETDFHCLPSIRRENELDRETLLNDDFRCQNVAEPDSGATFNFASYRRENRLAS